MNFTLLSSASNQKNNAGGNTFTLDKWKRLERFLILGVDGGTFYVTPQKHAFDNAECVRDCVAEDPTRAVNMAVDVSVNGRAAKNDPAIYVLAMASKHSVALDAMPLVCRTATHLFHFLEFSKQVRGWGNAYKRAITKWYETKSDGEVAYQFIKYRQRDGWTHRDVFRKIRPKSDREVYKWLFGNLASKPELLMLQAYGQVSTATTVEEVLDGLATYNLPWECVPTQFLNDPRVWERLEIPYTAYLRNLPRFANIGYRVDPQRLLNVDNKVHPMALLNALTIYSSGRSRNLTFTSEYAVRAALEEAFYKSFANVPLSDKRTLLALDVSGSMSMQCSGAAFSCAMGSCAMALVTARRNSNVMLTAFSDVLRQLNPESANYTLEQMLQYTRKITFGGTDCALPMLEAKNANVPVDTFVIYTDNETWAGAVEPYIALEQYRAHSGIDSKLVVVAMTATPFSIANPNDPGMLDVVGFDTTTPQVINSFV